MMEATSPNSPSETPPPSGEAALQGGKAPADSTPVRYEEVDFWDDYDRRVEAGLIPHRETYHETLERLGRSLRSIL